MERSITLNDLLNCVDYKEEKVKTPEWGEGTFAIVRSMSSEARDKYESSIFKMVDGEVVRNYDNMRAKLVAACVVDANGLLLFKNEDHVNILGQKSSAVVDRLWQAAQRVNEISDEAMAEIEGN